MSERGGIRNEDAYARGKMLDHSGWQKGEIRLPRLITPSDVDMVFDNDTWLLLCEVSSEYASWRDLQARAKGQIRMYQALIGQTANCAVLCKHSVPLIPYRPIDTRNDIDKFEVMLWDVMPGIVFTETFCTNKRWQDFVFSWFQNPKKTRMKCLQNAFDKDVEESQRSVNDGSAAII